MDEIAHRDAELGAVRIVDRPQGLEEAIRVGEETREVRAWLDAVEVRRLHDLHGSPFADFDLVQRVRVRDVAPQTPWRNDGDRVAALSLDERAHQV